MTAREFHLLQLVTSKNPEKELLQLVKQNLIGINSGFNMTSQTKYLDQIIREFSTYYFKVPICPRTRKKTTLKQTKASARNYNKYKAVRSLNAFKEMTIAFSKDDINVELFTDEELATVGIITVKMEKLLREWKKNSKKI